MKLALIPQDKANHIIDGALVYVVARFLAVPFFPAQAREIALGVSALAGAAKEALDWWLNRRAAASGAKPSHGVEFLDFAATAGGGFACYLAGA